MHISWRDFQPLLLFLRLSGFLNLFGKVFLIAFKFSLFKSWTNFLKEKKTYSFYTKNYFFLIRVPKSKKKKLVLTLFYCLGQETWLDDSWKLIFINQSRFYNFSQLGKFRRGATNFEILSATMLGRRKKFCISNRLKRLKNLNICSR